MKKWVSQKLLGLNGTEQGESKEGIEKSEEDEEAKKDNCQLNGGENDEEKGSFYNGCVKRGMQEEGEAPGKEASPKMEEAEKRNLCS